MKSKILGLMTLSILALVMLVGLTSATFTISDFSNPSPIDTNKGTFDLTFNLTNEDLVNSATITWTDSIVSGGDATFSSFSPNNILANETLESTVRVSFDKGYTGTISGTIYANSSTTEQANQPFSVEITGPEEVETCNIAGNQYGALELEIEDIQVISGFGEDNEWFPLDEIEVEVRVEYDGSEKMQDIVVKWGLYDLDTEEWVFDDEESDFNLKDGDKEDLLITFRLDDPDEFEDGGDYVFFVWAEGEDEEYDDFLTCVATSEEITIEIESDFLILDNIELENVIDGKVGCGNTVHVTADIWNIGEDDQEEVSIVVSNEALGINEILEIGDVDKFDSEAISFEFQVPEGMEEKTYTLKFTIYDEDHDVYENDYNDEKAVFDVYLKVEGNCALAQALVSAIIDEGGKAGKELIIRSTITNTGTKETTYSVNSIGYAEWASSVIIEPITLVLEAEQSADVLITLKVNGDVSGERLFNIEVLSEGELVVSQPLSVSIEKALFGNLFNEDNGLLTALIIGIALILVIIIIVLAIRVARR